ADALLAPRPDQQVDRRALRRRELAGEHALVDRGRLELAGRGSCGELPCRLNDIPTTAVRDRDHERHAAIVARAPLCGLACGAQLRVQLRQVTDELQSDAV